MKIQLKTTAALAMAGVSLALSLSLAAAQETPTPGEQDSRDEAMNALMTRQAVINDRFQGIATPVPDAEAAPLVFDFADAPDERFELELGLFPWYFYPSPDGRWIAADTFHLNLGTADTNDYHKTVLLFDLQTGEVTEYYYPRLFQGNSRDMIGFSPDSRYLVMPVDGTGLTMIDLETGEDYALAGFPSFHAFAFSADSRYLAMGGEQPDIRVIDVETRETVARWETEVDYHYFTRFVPGRNVIVTIGAHGLEVWNMDDESLLYADDNIASVIVHPDGDRMFVLTWDHKLAVVSLDTFDVLEQVDVPDSAVYLDTFSPDNQTLIIGDEEDALHFYDVATLTRHLTADLRGRLPSISFSPDSRFAVPRELDFHLFSHEDSASEWEEHITFSDEITREVVGTSFLPDGRLVLLQFENLTRPATVEVWDVLQPAVETAALPDETTDETSSGSARLTAATFDRIEPLASHEVEGGYVVFDRNAYRLDNQWLNINSFEGTNADDLRLTIWLVNREALDEPAQAVVIESPVESELPLINVGDGRLYYLEDFNELFAYEVATGEISAEMETNAEFGYFQIGATPNTVVGFMENDELVVWDAPTEEIIARWPTPRGMLYGIILLNGRALTFHRDQSLNVIDVQTGEILGTWEDMTLSFSAALGNEDVFYLQTLDDEILRIDSATLETIDRLNLGVPLTRWVVTTDGRFIIGWTPDDEILIRSFETDTPARLFPPMEADSFDTNANGDLMLVLKDEAYTLYHLSDEGLEEIDLPEELRDSDGEDELLFFRAGDELIAVDYTNRRQKVRITFWGIAE